MTFREAATHPVQDGHCQSCNVIVAYEACDRENAQLRERLAASEKLTAAYEQQERIACQVNVELTELLTATEKAATDFRARAEAEFAGLREQLLADARGTFSEMAKRAFIQAADEVDAAHKRLMGGAA